MDFEEIQLACMRSLHLRKRIYQSRISKKKSFKTYLQHSRTSPVLKILQQTAQGFPKMLAPTRVALGFLFFLEAIWRPVCDPASSSQNRTTGLIFRCGLDEIKYSSSEDESISLFSAASCWGMVVVASPFEVGKACPSIASGEKHSSSLLTSTIFESFFELQLVAVTSKSFSCAKQEAWFISESLHSKN